MQSHIELLVNMSVPMRRRSSISNDHTKFDKVSTVDMSPKVPSKKEMEWLPTAIQKFYMLTIEPYDFQYSIFVDSFMVLRNSMTIVGLPLQASRKVWLKVWNFIVLSVYVTSLCFNFSGQAFLMAKGAQMEAFYRTFSCLKLSTSMFMIYKFYSNRKSASVLLFQLEECFAQLGEEYYSRKSFADKLRYYVILNTMIGWGCVAFFSGGFVVGTILEQDLHNYIEKYWFGVNATAIGHDACLMMSIIETCIYYLATMAPIQFVSLYYAFMCIIMTEAFQIFNGRIKRDAINRNCNIPAKKIRAIRDNHNKLTKTVEQLDSAMSAPVFLIYMVIIIDMSKYVYFVMDKLTRGWSTSIEVVFVFFRIFHMLWLFFMISCSASNVAINSNACLEDVHQMTTRLTESENMGNVEFHSIALITKLTEQPMYLTGWNVFYITRGFILTVIGGVLTYTLVVMQLIPWMWESHNKLKQ